MNLNPNPDRAPRKPSTQQMSAFEAAVDYAERQDIFLYFTAFMGIFMPAAVYFLYMKVHNYYQDKWKREAEINEIEKLRKKEERRKRRNANLRTNIKNNIEEIEISNNAPLTIKIFYSLENEEIEKIINDQLKNLSPYSPNCYNLSTMNIDEFLSFQGLSLFIIESNKDGTITEDTLWFFEFLQDYEERKENLKSINYSIFGISDTKYGGKIYQKSGKLLSSLMHKLSAKSISPICFGDLKVDKSINDQLEKWINKIDTLCQQQLLLRKEYECFMKESKEVSKKIEEDVKYDSEESLDEETDEDEDDSDREYSDTESTETDSFENETKKEK
uniref:Flavodoxin-like domain-containing protein n=1 Tax=Strongyloides venezuelensis TaxID=75913 RepID=A0A0K0FXG1_STRVS